MLHAIETNQGSGPTKACFTVDCNSTGLGVGEVLLACGHKLSDDFCRRSRTINEDHIVMGDVLGFESSLVILGLVQADNPGDIEMPENLSVAGG